MSDDEQALGRLYFHHGAHERWTDRQLYFWFLRAEALYERATVKTVLKGIADDLGIGSYATYELIGEYDLLIRLYLKPGSGVRAFRDAVTARISAKAPSRSFQVADVARHWVWTSEDGDGGGEIETPSKEVLAQHYPRTELALLNDQGRGGEERLQLIDRYSRLDLVRVAVPVAGIKVVITIGFNEHPVHEQVLRVRDQLGVWLDRIKEPIHERSLYVGDGDHTQQFIVMCRVDHHDFHRIRKWLIDPIGSLVGGVAVRTTTYPVVSPDFVCFEESIELPAEDRPDVTTLMRSHELDSFEVKGSLLAPLDPWLKTGKPLIEQPTWPLKSVLKGVVGLLNSGGGTMVIGALEESKYKDHPRALEQLRQYPAVGPHRVVGLVDPTYEQHGWDAWERRLNDLLATKIKPSPGVLVQWRHAELEGQSICLIDVDEPREDATFWLSEAKDKEVFYARVGTSVTALQGPEIDKHRADVGQRRSGRRNRS